MTTPTDDSRLAVVEREVRGMHDTLKELSGDVKALNQSFARSEQQHQQHQRMSDENKAELQQHDTRLTQVERTLDRQAGSIATFRWISGVFAAAAITAIGWLLSVVLNSQSAIHVQQSKQADAETRLQRIEQRSDGP
jgi:chromosome segregation ATPase